MTPTSEYLGADRVAAAFRAIYAARRTGVLRLRRDGGACAIAFSGGHVTHAEAGRGQLRLAERMAARGLLTRDEYRRGVEQALAQGTRVGTALVSLGVVDEDGLRQALALHAKEIVSELLVWTEGTIKFEPRDASGGPYDQPLALSNAQLIAEASRAISDPDVFAAALERDARVGPARDPLLRLQLLRWPPAERLVVEAVGAGDRTVAEILAYAPLPSSQTERILATLHWAGVLELEATIAERPPFERELPRRDAVLEMFRGLRAVADRGLLGVEADATDAEIELGFLRVAGSFHPDGQHTRELSDLGEQLEAIFTRAASARDLLA